MMLEFLLSGGLLFLSIGLLNRTREKIKMNNEKFLELDKVSSKIEAFFKDSDQSEKLNDIKKTLQNFCQSLPEQFSITFSLNLGIYDDEREKNIDVSEIGISFNGSDKSHLIRERYEFCRYIVKGNIVEIPFNYCPVCWGEWYHKKEGCPDCNSMIGKHIQYLVESNKCPNCIEGEISPENPKCDICAFNANFKDVVWH